MARSPRTKIAALLAGVFAALYLPHADAAINSVISFWLTAAQQSVLTVGVEHQQAARVYGIVAAAQHDSIVAARGYKNASISDEVVAAYAGHFALSTLFNWRQTGVFDAALRSQLASVNTTALLPHLQRVVVPIVIGLVNRRIQDRSSFFSSFVPFSNATENIGRYQFTPGQTSARFPQVANASGFYLSNSEINSLTSRYRRFSLNDTEYARQLEQVFWFGSVNSTNRSAYDTNSPRFWALGTGTGTIAGVWLNISISVLPDTTPLLAQARFFKLLTTSYWDAAISVWRIKYRELFWRPITALRTPHNTSLGPAPYDPNWTPLLATPAHPEYASGHQTTSGVAVYVLETYLGTNFTFNATSNGAPDVGSRRYSSFRQAGLESGDSRLYGGVHFHKANIDAFNLGIAVAQRIHTRAFRSSAPLTFSELVPLYKVLTPPAPPPPPNDTASPPPPDARRRMLVDV